MDTAAPIKHHRNTRTALKRPCVNVHLLNRAEHLRRSLPRILYGSSAKKNASAYFLIYSLKTLCTFLKLQSRWRTAKLSQDWLFSETACQFFFFFFCISSSVCQASSHHDLGWRPLCQAVKYVGERSEGGERERVYQASSSTISAPVFFPAGCLLSIKRWLGGAGTLPAGTRWGGCLHLQFWDEKDAAVCAARAPLFVCTYHFHSNEHCTVVGPL